MAVEVESAARAFVSSDEIAVGNYVIGRLHSTKIDRTNIKEYESERIEDISFFDLGLDQTVARSFRPGKHGRFLSLNRKLRLLPVTVMRSSIVNRAPLIRNFARQSLYSVELLFVYSVAIVNWSSTSWLNVIS